jgi:hypothetical protein
MALVVDDLAQALFDSLSNKTDKDGNEPALTDEAKGYARGFINALKDAKSIHAPGTITGTAPPGGSLSNGLALPVGTMVPLVPATMTAEIVTSGQFPLADVQTITDENNAVIGIHFTGVAKTSFESGSITGTCTATAISPGILAAGEGADGKIELCDGAVLAALVTSTIGYTGPDMIPFYTALCDYVKNNAEITYASGKVTGTFSAGGGPLVAGAGLDGEIG